MVLKLPTAKLPVRPLPPPIVAARNSAAVAAPKPEAKKPGKARTVTVRMPDNHMVILEEDMATLESDKTEAVKRAIRLQHTVLSAKEATLILTASNGEKSSIPLMRNGVPC